MIIICRITERLNIPPIDNKKRPVPAYDNLRGAVTLADFPAVNKKQKITMTDDQKAEKSNNKNQDTQSEPPRSPKNNKNQNIQKKGTAAVTSSKKGGMGAATRSNNKGTLKDVTTNLTSNIVWTAKTSPAKTSETTNINEIIDVEEQRDSRSNKNQVSASSSSSSSSAAATSAAPQADDAIVGRRQSGKTSRAEKESENPDAVAEGEPVSRKSPRLTMNKESIQDLRDLINNNNNLRRRFKKVSTHEMEIEVDPGPATESEANIHEGEFQQPSPLTRMNLDGGRPSHHRRVDFFRINNQDGASPPEDLDDHYQESYIPETRTNSADMLTHEIFGIVTPSVQASNISKIPFTSCISISQESASESHNNYHGDTESMCDRASTTTDHIGPAPKIYPRIAWMYREGEELLAPMKARAAAIAAAWERSSLKQAEVDSTNINHSNGQGRVLYGCEPHPNEYECLPIRSDDHYARIGTENADLTLGVLDGEVGIENSTEVITFADPAGVEPSITTNIPIGFERSRIIKDDGYRIDTPEGVVVYHAAWIDRNIIIKSDYITLLPPAFHQIRMIDQKSMNEDLCYEAFVEQLLKIPEMRETYHVLRYVNDIKWVNMHTCHRIWNYYLHRVPGPRWRDWRPSAPTWEDHTWYYGTPITTKSQQIIDQLLQQDLEKHKFHTIPCDAIMWKIPEELKRSRHILHWCLHEEVTQQMIDDCVKDNRLLLNVLGEDINDIVKRDNRATHFMYDFVYQKCVVEKIGLTMSHSNLA